MNERYLFVIGGGLLQIPLIKEANDLGLKTIVSDFNENCIAKEYADIFVHLDIFNIKGHLRYLENNPLKIVGVLAAGIDAPETMAAMNEYLNLKGASLEKALLCKNKDKFRIKLKQLGYPTPEFKIINNQNIDELEKYLEQMPYPLIVKPTNNSASRDMKIFDINCEELKCFIKKNMEKYSVLLLEQMWQGEEQTVECLVDVEGVFHEGFITDRKFTFENGFPIETSLIHPTELDEKKQKELFTLAKNISKDLEIETGAVKLDTIYTKEGPRIIELTLRHSGGFDCQFLVPRSTGKNILKAAILTAIGQKFDKSLLKDTLKKVGMTSSIWPKSGIITKIEGIEEAKKIEGIEEIFTRFEVGDEIKPYENCASRVIFIIASAKDKKQVEKVIDLAKSLIKIETK